MNRRFSILFLLLILPTSARAFLSDSDPQNFFMLLDQAPSIVLASARQTLPPEGARRYFVHELEIRESLYGQKLPSRVKVLQEVFFPNDPKIYPESGEFVACLAPLPNYTAYAAARQDGVEYRSFGASAGVLPFGSGGTDEALALVRQWLATRTGGGSALERKNILLSGLVVNDARLRNDAAIALAKLPIQRGFFAPGDYPKMEAALANLKPEAQVALIQAIAASGDASAVESLKRIAGGPASPAKWAAIQSLERLGVARSLTELQADFSQAGEKDKPRLVAALVARPDEATRGFLNSLLAGGESLNLKRDVLEQMAQKGGGEYEAIVIEQTNNRDEQVAMQAVVALGLMSGDKPFDRIVVLLDSPSAKIRGAAGMALMRSPDPRAVKIYKEKFEEQGFGHFH